MTKSQSKLEHFAVSPNDPLAAAHAAVASFVEDAMASLGESRYYHDTDLKSLPSGQKLLDATPEQAVQYVNAAVLQVCHWDRLANDIRAQAENESQRLNAHL